MTKPLVAILVAPVLLAAGHFHRAAGKVHLTIGTLHAAALTTPRAAGDTSDAPFFMMSVLSSHESLVSMMPGKPLSIQLNQALGARPLTDVTLAEGDSVQVLLSVLENATADLP